MTIDRKTRKFTGLPVVNFSKDLVNVSTDPADVSKDTRTDVDPSTVAWRLSGDYERPKEFVESFTRLLETVPADKIEALIFGNWGEASERTCPAQLLVDAADRLVNLRGIFLGDMTSEDCEISWIQQDDVTPLLRAYPRLQTLRVRGAEGLELEPLRHEALRKLVFESGGLGADVVRAVGECDLPELEHLELWLGTSDYGGDANVEDLGAILAGVRLPKLRRLGLRDAEIVDLVAAALAAAPVVARLEKLDLSMGILTDAGAEALLAGQPLTHLGRLNLRHHYLSEGMVRRLVAELPGVKVNVGDRQSAKGDERRYVAVSE